MLGGVATSVRLRGRSMSKVPLYLQPGQLKANRTVLRPSYPGNIMHRATSYHCFDKPTGLVVLVALILLESSVASLRKILREPPPSPPPKSGYGPSQRRHRFAWLWYHDLSKSSRVDRMESLQAKNPASSSSAIGERLTCMSMLYGFYWYSICMFISSSVPASLQGITKLT